MPKKTQWETIRRRIKEILEVLRRINPLTRERVVLSLQFIRKSWKSIAILLPTFLVLYYVVGSWATHNIDKSLIDNVSKPEKGLAVADSAAGLIMREVDDHMWTPNLPLIFPGYVLDNMPQYQLGIIRSLKSTVQVLARCYDSPDLNKAAELLSYPGNVWLLSKTENLALAPSSGAQYRKARKALLRFNDKPQMPKIAQNKILPALLENIAKNLGGITIDIEKQVREYSSDWTDGLADNVFYYNQGRLYGFYVILKALAEDFQPQILAAGQYENWTSLNKMLENGFMLNPLIIRNGRPDDTFAPNHLLVLGWYTAKAELQLNKIINALAQQEENNAH